MSHSPPSGLRSGMIQISRLLTRFVTRLSVPYLSVNSVEHVQRHLDGEVLTRVLVVR